MVSVQTDIPANIPRSSQTIYDNAPRIIISLVGWFMLYFAAVWASKTFIPKVRIFKPKEQMFWGLAIVRGICGLLTAWAGYLIFVDERFSVDHVFSSTDESWIFLSMIIGFAAFEELALIYFDIRYGTFSKELHAHHIIGFSVYFLMAFFNTGHIYAARVFFLEASTPFSCLCWCLLKLKLERTKVWKINQWILIYVFHARTFYELWGWYTLYHDWDNMKQNMPWISIASLVTGLALVTFWLTPYWTYRKTQQFFFPVDWNIEAKDKKKNEIDKTS